MGGAWTVESFVWRDSLEVGAHFVRDPDLVDEDLIGSIPSGKVCGQ